MRRVRRFLRLSSADRRLLLGAVSLLAATRLSLSVLSFQTLQRLVSHRARVIPRVREERRVSVDRVAWAISVAGRYVPAATCLAQALAAQALLSDFGYEGRLRIGVARSDEGEFEAHAWLECNGRVIPVGSQIDRYTPLLALGCQASERW